MKVTTKGQVTIPVRVRRYLGIAPFTEVDFRITAGEVILFKPDHPSSARPAFSELRGVLKGTRTTRAWMRETRGA